MTTATIAQAGERRSSRIESLRALAALAVVVGHSYGWSHLYAGSLYGSYLGRALLGGGFGVTLFFTLSGYLLFLPFVRSTWGHAPRIALKQYALNRALRVLPLYYVVIAFFLVTEGGTQQHLWWRYALMIEGFWSDSVARVDGPIWSLAVEVQFYALLPLFALLLGRLSRGSLRTAAVLVLALGLAALALRELTVHRGSPSLAWRYSLPAWAVFFLPGLLLAMAKVRCEQRVPSRLQAGPLAQPLVWIAPSVGLLLGVFASYRWDALLLPGWFLLVGSCVLPLGSDRGLRWLDWRPLSLVGVASYSLYLWHEPLVRHLRTATWGPHGFLALLAVAAPVSIAVALVSYRLIERPFLLRRRQWSRVPDLDELPAFVTSSSYWEARYAAGATSGVGSYSQLARFKAEVLNAFVREHHIRSVVELGCGDGNQLSLADYPSYVGYDVAPSAVDLCRTAFRKDRSKSFHLYDPLTFQPDETSDLALSLDVIFHLVEDEVFERHMTDLFSLGSRFVAIYSSNDETPDIGHHVRNRRFTTWIEEHRPDWPLLLQVPNPYRGAVEGAISDFWFYAAPTEPSEH
ncbi:MAG: glycosyl transferase group 1 [Frankiales bacterium]|nr:glycosyl transferase group 1 [Frankiales bacterium]